MGKKFQLKSILKKSSKNGKPKKKVTWAYPIIQSSFKKKKSTRKLQIKRKQVCN